MRGSEAPCLSALMINRIMTTRVAALAFAAIPLTAAPALADQPARASVTSTTGLSLSIGDASFYISAGNNNWRGRDGRYYRNDRYGQRPWETRQLRRQAVQQCAAVIQRKGYRAGFRDVDIDNDFRVKQIGPRGFRIRFDDVEFEGRRREFYRDVTCTVRRGDVVKIAGLPERANRGHKGRDRYDDRRDRWDDHRGHGRRDYSSVTTTRPATVTRTTTTVTTANPNDRSHGKRGKRDRKDDGLRGGRRGS